MITNKDIHLCVKVSSKDIKFYFRMIMVQLRRMEKRQISIENKTE